MYSLFLKFDDGQLFAINKKIFEINNFKHGIIHVGVNIMMIFYKKFQIHRKCCELYVLYDGTNYTYDFVRHFQQQLFCEFDKIPPVMLNPIINEVIY